MIKIIQHQTEQEHNRIKHIARYDNTAQNKVRGLTFGISQPSEHTQQQQAASNCFYSPAAADAPTDSPANLRLASEDGPGSTGCREDSAGEGHRCPPTMPNPN